MKKKKKKEGEGIRESWGWGGKEKKKRLKGKKREQGMRGERKRETEIGVCWCWNQDVWAQNSAWTWGPAKSQDLIPSKNQVKISLSKNRSTVNVLLGVPVGLPL